MTGTSGCSTNTSPTRLPRPVSTLTTPGGKWSNTTSAKRKVAKGVWLEGLMITVLPAAKAGATFQIISSIG